MRDRSSLFKLRIDKEKRVCGHMRYLEKNRDRRDRFDSAGDEISLGRREGR